MLIRNGKVAVLVHYAYGAEWYGDRFDPWIARVVLKEIDPTDEEIEAHFVAQGYNGFPRVKDVDELEVEWVTVGRRFLVREYDGKEWLEYEDQMWWYTAGNLRISRPQVPNPPSPSTSKGDA